MAEAKRRLAAILSADVAGYSRLMGDDERATLETLNAYRDIFRHHIAERDGRVVDTAGDSVLAVFNSVVEAVQCANEVQSELGTRNEDLPDDRRMLFRIGVNLGDVIEQDDGTIYGDGVNVAARLESLAEPGGIIVSEDAYRQVEGKTDLGFADMGEHEVKNIARPVRAYRVLTDGAPQAAPRAPQSRRTALITAAAAVVVIVAGVAVWQGTKAPPPPPMVTAAGIPTDDPVLATPTGPAIAVLPFDNLSEEPGQESFADGLTEEIITGLSRFNNLRVIARNSTFQYKGQAVDVREVGKALGVRYVLEGSVRRSGNSLRVSAQLLDARDGTHLWAENYDRDLTTADIFAIQDSIMERIVGVLGDEFGIISRAGLEETGARHTDNLTAYECVLRAYGYYDVITPAEHMAVRACLEEAVALDPTYAEAWGWLSHMYQDEYKFGFNPRPEADDPLARAIAASQKAIRADATSQIGYESLASSQYFAGDLEQFRTAAERAMSLNPNNSRSMAWMGQLAAWAGDWDRGIAVTDKAVDLNPNHPTWYHATYLTRHYLDANYEAALLSTKRYNLPGFYFHHRFLAMIYGQLGRLDEARASIAELNAQYPGHADVVRADLEKWFKDEALVSAMLEGLEKAGLFDEPEAPARPVIAVLPFTNMSGDPEQEYFSDGITEDIITRMTQFQELGVIARNSTFQYKGRAVDVRQVGEALGADYVVEGSVRTAGETIRITAQLIDTSDGTHLWAETFDRPRSTGDIFAIQDEITQQVASLVADRYGLVMQTVVRDISEKPSARLSSYECVLKATSYQLNFTEDNYYQSRKCLDRVTVEDPDYAEAWAVRAEVYVDGLTIWFDPDLQNLDQAVASATRAISLSPNLQFAHYALAYAYFAKGDVARFLVEAERAVALNPNNAGVIGPLGTFIAAAGKWDRGVTLVNQAIELNPHFPAWMNYVLAADHIRKGDYVAALENAQDYSARNPDYYWAHVIHATTLGLMGRTEDAQTSVAKVRTLNPDFEARAIAEWEKWVYDEAVVAVLVDGLRKAGMNIPTKTD